MILAKIHEYKDAFRKHFHAYQHWGSTGSNNSKRLVLIYSIESGLKYLIMNEKRISTVNQAQDDVRIELGSHDIEKLLKRLRMAAQYNFPPLHTRSGEEVRINTYHQMCRYCICPDKGSEVTIKKYDEQLDQLGNWIREQV